MAADAIAAAVDVETITVSGLYAFFSYVAAVVAAAAITAVDARLHLPE